MFASVVVSQNTVVFNNLPDAVCIQRPVLTSILFYFVINNFSQDGGIIFGFIINLLIFKFFEYVR